MRSSANELNQTGTARRKSPRQRVDFNNLTPSSRPSVRPSANEEVFSGGQDHGESRARHNSLRSV